jgi:hypothetical protein
LTWHEGQASSPSTALRRSPTWSTCCAFWYISAEFSLGSGHQGFIGAERPFALRSQCRRLPIIADGLPAWGRSCRRSSTLSSVSGINLPTQPALAPLPHHVDADMQFAANLFVVQALTAGGFGPFMFRPPIVAR